MAWDQALISKDFLYSHHILKFNFLESGILSALQRNIVESPLLLLFYFFALARKYNNK